MTEAEKAKAEAEAKAKAAAELDMEKVLDAKAIAAIVKETIAKDLPTVLSESLKPFLEKDAQLEEYAKGLIDLERSRRELQKKSEMKKGQMFGRWTRALALGKGDPDRGIHEATQHWGADDPCVKEMVEYRKKTVTSGTLSVIPTMYSADFIDLLRSKAVVRSIANVIPMPFGNLSIRKQTAGATAYYVAEAAAATKSEQTASPVNLSFKKLVALSPVSNDLLRFSGAVADMMILNDLLSAVAVREDAAFLSSDGTSNKPTGILNLCHADNTNADTGTTFAQQMADYTKAIKLVDDSDVPMDNEDSYWIMAARCFWGIYGTQALISTDPVALPFAAGLSLPEPRLLGFKVLKTSGAKRDTDFAALTTSTDKIYFVHGPSCILADSMSVNVTAFDGGAYDVSGTVKSGISQDETVIRAITEHDFALRWDTAASVIEGCSIGA